MGLGDEENSRRQREDGWPVEGIQQIEREEPEGGILWSHRKTPAMSEKKRHKARCQASVIPAPGRLRQGDPKFDTNG
jgi:hypothetical protein